MVPPELWDTAAPGGWESTGPQVRRTGSSERVSAYLASLGVPEPHPILRSGLRKQGALQQLGRKVAEVEVGSVSGSAAPLSPVSESSLFSALYAHLFLFHPLNGMFHLPWKPGGRGVGVPVQEKLCFLEIGISEIPPDTAADGRWRKGARATAEEDPRRTRQTQTRARSPEPGVGLSWRLEGCRHRSFLPPSRASSQVSDGHPDKQG